MGDQVTESLVALAEIIEYHSNSTGEATEELIIEGMLRCVL